MANSPWPAYNGGGKLQGRNQYSGSNVYRTVKWVYSFGSAASGDSDSCPALATDGTIYMGTRNTSSPKLYAINPSDGSVKWSYSLGSQMRGSVAVDDSGNIYFGADKFYSLDSNGNLNWSNSSGTYTMVYPNIDTDGTIYTDVVTASNNTRVRAFNSNGTVKWTSADYVTAGFNLGLHPPAYNDTYVYIVGNDKLVAVNKTDGSTAWTNTNVKPYTGHVAIGDNGYLYTAYCNNAWAVNSTGTGIWHNTETTGSNDQGFPSIGYNGTLYDGKYEVPRRVVAYNKDNGQILWEYSMEGIIFAASISIDRNENLYFGEATSGKATIINSAGSFKWSYKVSDSSSFASTIAVSDNGEMYSGNYNYKFYGWKLWTLSGTANTAYYHPGDTVTITATTSMLQTDPTSSENNQVQAVMRNGDKVALSYASSSGANTTWTGTWTIPTGTTDGSYSATVEAAAVNVQTDVTTHFASAPTGSSNTGLTSSFSYTVDNSSPSSWTNSEGALRTFSSSLTNNLFTTNNLPAFKFTKAGDTNSGISKYQILIKSESFDWRVYLDDISHGYSSGTIKDETDRYLEYLGDEIFIYSKKETDKLANGAYLWKVKAFDNAGNTKDSEERTLLINTRQALFSSSQTFFPLTLLQVGEKTNLNLSSLNTPNFPTSLSITSNQPTFYGISSVNSKITLKITQQKEDQTEEAVLTQETITNQESRFGINLTSPLPKGEYLINLSASQNFDYVELPEFKLTVGFFSYFTSEVKSADTSEVSESEVVQPTPQPKDSTLSPTGSFAPLRMTEDQKTESQDDGVKQPNLFQKILNFFTVILRKR